MKPRIWFLAYDEFGDIDCVEDEKLLMDKHLRNIRYKVIEYKAYEELENKIKRLNAQLGVARSKKNVP